MRVNPVWKLGLTMVVSTAAMIGSTLGLEAQAASASYASILPHGTTQDMSKTFTVDGHEMLVVTTKGIAPEQAPWIVVARRDGSTWAPIDYMQTKDAFMASGITLAKAHGNQRGLAISFIVDGATGMISNIYTLDVSKDSASVVATLPEVIEAQQVQAKGDGFLIRGLNLQVKESPGTNHWNLQSTPVSQLLAHAATHTVRVLMGEAQMNTKDKGKVYVIGASSMTAKVGDTLAFLPANQQTADQLLGAYPTLGTANGISVYVALPGTPIGFAQVNQVMSASYRFTSPGTYKFAVVPPQYMNMKPNANVAILTVKVTQ